MALAAKLIPLFTPKKTFLSSVTPNKLDGQLVLIKRGSLESNPELLSRELTMMTSWHASTAVLNGIVFSVVGGLPPAVTHTSTARSNFALRNA